MQSGRAAQLIPQEPKRESRFSAEIRKPGDNGPGTWVTTLKEEQRLAP